MKNILTILLTILIIHSMNAQVFYEKDTLFLTVEQAEEISQDLKPMLYNNTIKEIKYKWRTSKIKAPTNLEIISEDQNFQTIAPSSCSLSRVNTTAAGGNYPSIGIDAILSDKSQPDSLPWIILFEVLRAPSCDSLYTSLVYVVGDLLSSSDHNTSLNKFSIFPNPCNDFITIQTNEDDIYNVQIYDYMGKYVLQRNHLIGTSKLETDHLPKGIYTLRKESKFGQVNHHRFIK